MTTRWTPDYGRFDGAEPVVVCYHLDRVARDVAARATRPRVWSKRGVELHVVGRGRIEAETATGLLMTGIEGLLAERYRKVISEKMRDAMARLRATGRRISRFPLARTLADRGADQLQGVGPLNSF